MTTTTSSFGMDHPTVVPVNFDPDGRDETGDPESTLAGAAER